MSSASTQAWELSNLLAGWAMDAVPDCAIEGISLDSRLTVPGDLYLAVDGASTHGIHFAAQAVAAGARAVLTTPDAMVAHADIVSELRAGGVPVVPMANLSQHCAELASRFYGSPDKAMTLIAVTGTDGKTSVCRFIAQALTQLNQHCGYIGTIGWGIGDTLNKTQLTTPDVVSLRRILATLRDQGAEFVALEASSHGLAEDRLKGLSIDVAVLTNLGRDHLDYHGTVEAYRAAKAQLFSWPQLSAMVVNGCDAMGQVLLATDTSANAFSYCAMDDGSSEKFPATTHIQARNVETLDTGLEFDLIEGGCSHRVETILLGRFNVDNLLACYGSLRACGIPANDAQHCLAHVKPVDGRMERFGGQERPTVVVDFSHTPQALSVAIAAARVHCKGSLWVVFGCGGDRDPGKRAPMAAAAETADHVVLTDDNPRTEASQDIIDSAMKGFTDPSGVTVIADRAAAIRYAVTQASPDDLVLVAGKGHEDYQIIGTQKFPFSDRAEVLAALELAS